MTNNACLVEVKRAYRLMVMIGMKCELSARSGTGMLISASSSLKKLLVAGELLCETVAEVITSIFWSEWGEN
jgi:hypothetical protein